jgi:hypothetical protein
MKISALYHQSKSELRWLSDDKNYREHLIEISQSRFCETRVIINLVESRKWDAALEYLQFLETNLIKSYIIDKHDIGNNLETLPQSNNWYSEISKKFTEQSLVCIKTLEKTTYIQDNVVELADSENLRELLGGSSRDDISFMYRGSVLLPRPTTFCYEETRKVLAANQVDPEAYVLRNLLCLVGYIQKIIMYAVADFNRKQTVTTERFIDLDKKKFLPPLIAVKDANGTCVALRIGRKSQISFHRTLRIPEDGNDYPLPASLGTLPIHRVEDFAETVPADWLERGGFFIPLYQREALFLQFEGEQAHPAISKVCVGRINAITGKPYENRLSPQEQDYIVIPDQKWLDGINSGKDIVKQFVAMPLGQGYTVEGQITDEENYGGFQLEIFEPKDGYFDEPDYSVEKKIDLVVRISKSEFEAMLLQTNRLCRTIVNSIRTGATAYGAAYLTGLDKDHACRIYFDFKTRFFEFVENLVRVKFAEDPWFTTIRSRSFSNLSSLGLRDEIDPPPKAEKLDSETKQTDLAPEIEPRKIATLGSSEECSGALYSSPSTHIHTEMGIAAGGRLQQQILKDRYGIEAWDSQRSRFIDIHIVNSEMYQAITGLEPLSSPVSPEQYQKSGIPWFSHYAESAQSVKAAGAFKKIQSIAEIDKKRGLHGQHQEARRSINPDVIRRIRTPDIKEAATEFRRRAYENAAAARWKEAIREINYLIDLGLKISASDYALRSHCNYQLDQFFESDIDSDLALEIDPGSVDALVLKARCSLTLGDHEGAKTAAEALVSFKPPNPIGYEVLAESALIRRDFKEAQQNVSLAFTFGLESDRADEIAKLASEALANE